MCYATPSNDVGSMVGVNGMKNVSKEFVTWFKFGFFLNIGNLCVGLLQILHFITEANAIAMFWMCIAGPLGCGGVAWLITGMVFRWRHIGKVCSGDYYGDQAVPIGEEIYMWKSGKFM